MKNFFRSLSVGVAAWFAAGNLNAAGYVTENIAIRAQVRLTAASAEVFASEDGGAENTDITVLFGMSYFLPP